ncbi:MAG: hypothetical protein KAU17_05935 [Spirochaetales bacterium]|nr:hypothetical protein [Spirochaetales bacterium]
MEAQPIMETVTKRTDNTNNTHFIGINIIPIAAKPQPKKQPQINTNKRECYESDLGYKITGYAILNEREFKILKWRKFISSHNEICVHPRPSAV